MKKIWETLKREFFIAETLRYLIIGLVCTFVNLGSAYLFKNILTDSGIAGLAHNAAAIGTALGCVFAAIVAFFGNKIFVFKSKSWKFLDVIKEFFGTISARALSFFFITFGMKLCVDNDIFHLVPFLQKEWGLTAEFAKGVIVFWFFRCTLGVIEIAFNYIMNKLVIFRKKRLQKMENAQPESEND